MRRLVKGRKLQVAAVFLVSGIGLLQACAPRLERASVRNPDLFEKGSDRLQGASRPSDAEKAPELFVRRREIQAKPVERPNESGSLFNADDERNYLFTSTGPMRVGRFLDVKVVANRRVPPAEPTTSPPPAEGGGDDLEAELIKALPELEPAKKDALALMQRFKMKILHRYDNGDVLAGVVRHSSKDGEANEVNAQARIPYDRLSSGDQLTTEDLLDVRYLESSEGELIERRSSGWEDEYTMRLSGFSEIKSKHAEELESKQKQLLETRNNLQNRIKSLGDERKQIAKLRDDLTKKQDESQKKINDLQGQVQEQGQTIKQQEEQIKELENKPEDKPGDKKDAEN